MTKKKKKKKPDCSLGKKRKRPNSAEEIEKEVRLPHRSRPKTRRANRPLVYNYNRESELTGRGEGKESRSLAAFKLPSLLHFFFLFFHSFFFSLSFTPFSLPFSFLLNLFLFLLLLLPSLLLYFLSSFLPPHLSLARIKQKDQQVTSEEIRNKRRNLITAQTCEEIDDRKHIITFYNYEKKKK